MQSLLNAAGVEASHLRKLERFGDSGIPRSLLGGKLRAAASSRSTSRVRRLPRCCQSATLASTTEPAANHAGRCRSASELRQACRQTRCAIRTNGPLPCSHYRNRSVLACASRSSDLSGKTIAQLWRLAAVLEAHCQSALCGAAESGAEGVARPHLQCGLRRGCPGRCSGRERCAAAAPCHRFTKS